MHEKIADPTAEIKRILCQVIQTVRIDDGVDLIEGGLLDSFGIVKLVSELEQQFGVSIPGDKVSVENFSRIDTIVRLLEDLQNPRAL
jgi:acyl carrier protein